MSEWKNWITRQEVIESRGRTEMSRCIGDDAREPTIQPAMRVLHFFFFCQLAESSCKTFDLSSLFLHLWPRQRVNHTTCSDSFFWRVYNTFEMHEVAYVQDMTMREAPMKLTLAIQVRVPGSSHPKLDQGWVSCKYNTLIYICICICRLENNDNKKNKTI